MQAEERKHVIEEVTGISIYESRKEKSLKELEKTEAKLKEVSAILRERTAYLNNLEKEREAALKHKKLEEDLRRYKKSIIYFDLSKKKKEEELISKNIEEKNKEVEKIKKLILTHKTTIENLEEKISEINSTIQKQTGLEQEKLNQEIANLRAEIAGLSVKKESHEKKIKDSERQKNQFEISINENESSVKELQKASPTIEKIQKELSIKKAELERLEIERKKYYMTKTEFRTITDRVEDKKSILQNYENESNFLLKQIDNLSTELFDKKTTESKVEALKVSLVHKKEILETFNVREREIEKMIHTNESKIEEQKKVIEKIGKLDVCPLCKSKITKEHVHSITDESNPKVQKLKEEIKEGDKELAEIYSKRDNIRKEIEEENLEVQKRQSDLMKLRTIKDKDEQIRGLNERLAIIRKELEELKKHKEKLENNLDDNLNIESRYETLKMEVQDISLRNKENLSSELAFKERELERARISIKQIIRESEDLTEELFTIKKNLMEKESSLNLKRKLEEELIKKADNFIQERDLLQSKIRETEAELSKNKNQVYNLEQIINNFRIDKARIDAEIENFETEILEFPNVDVVKSERESLIERLRKTEETLMRIGTVNMRALEVYEEIKDEYETVKEKVDVITKEKEDVLKIIKEIDIKKKRAFVSTLTELNEIFTRNFSQISTKGQVSLEVQNKKDPFEGGVDIIVKTGHGKYFDIKSLSGGEQTMVALSLIFAIQELKPYAFYILDEIDAALDKRNSERLAGLLQKYMKRGQYIVITHNDEVITNATNLFGVSMHEGISKVISLKV